MKRCISCLMPDTRPRIVFDATRRCNACAWAAEKDRIDWAARGAEFRELLSTYRGKGAYDCIVPFSGGKDSATVAWKLKFEYGMKPLLVTYGQLMWTDEGRHNHDALVSAGFECLYWRVDQRVSRHLAQRFMIERGHPKLHYDAGVNAAPLITAVKFGIPLVVYAEHGESEYGGLVLSAEARRSRDLAEVLENQVGDDARNWADDVVSERELYPYIYPEADEVARIGIEAVYFSYFHRWASPLNAKFIASKIDWRVPESVNGTFTNFDSIDDKIDGVDFWMMSLKYGFGRAVRDANRHVQNGLITRAEGARLARLFDDEFPRRWFGEVLTYMSMTEREFFEAAERHRNPQCWTAHDGGWSLKCPL